MTNGEKIKEIFSHFDVEDKTEYFGRLRNLDDHFIKADIDFWNAEYKEPTTKNDLAVDCISRADAIKGLGEQPYVWTDSDFEIQQLADWKTHKEMLENLPSVTPQEPRKGHWIGNYQVGSGEWQEYDVKLSDGFVTDNCHCSECGEELLSGDRGMFCPYCGSDNREVEE